MSGCQMTSKWALLLSLPQYMVLRMQGMPHHRQPTEPARQRRTWSRLTQPKDWTVPCMAHFAMHSMLRGQTRIWCCGVARRKIDI